jgi:hypothetical protein
MIMAAEHSRREAPGKLRRASIIGRTKRAADVPREARER